MSTFKDLYINLQIRKYTINNEWGKSCLLYPGKQFRQFSNHFIRTEELVYAF